MIMAKRLQDDFNAYLEERGWAAEAMVTPEDVRDLLQALGFAGVESPTDLKLLKALVEVLREPELEGIMVGNVAVVLKAIMKLSKTESSITPLKVIDMSGIQGSDYGAVGRDDLSSTHNVSGDKSMLFSSFLGGHSKRITFGEDHRVTLTSREQHWLSSYFTLLGRNRQDA